MGVVLVLLLATLSRSLGEVEEWEEGKSRVQFLGPAQEEVRGRSKSGGSERWWCRWRWWRGRRPCWSVE